MEPPATDSVGSQVGSPTVPGMSPAAASAYSVLVVEDHAVIGGLLRDGLRSHGYEASWVESVAGAGRALAEASYDVVLVDLGLPDGDGLDKPVACVVTQGPLTQEELIHWCRQELAHFKCPRAVVFTDELPKTATGKLQRFKVRQLVAEQVRP